MHLLQRKAAVLLSTTSSAVQRDMEGEHSSGAPSMPEIVSETFDGGPLEPNWCWSQAICDHSHLVDHGSAENKALEIDYEPSKEGSMRLQKTNPLDALTSAALTYDVFFGDGFEWVKGGKLGFGLFGGTATTGCKSIDPAGFSMRAMWRRNGTLTMYLYDQKRTERCGHDVYATDGSEPFHFQTGTWYRLTLYAKLNEPYIAANGIAAMYVDGNKVAEETGVQWRAAPDVYIDRWGLSTFYGGNDPSWAPSHATHILYDNVQVTGIRHAGEVPDCPATCATNSEHKGWDVVCRWGSCALCSTCASV